MTYSRQQRDRAVDLYIRYECCAADAIHELGYPSKEALRMWYRERLEEERTGVPSRRGERQRRYSEEQKRTAVDHYLECGRRLSRTMRMLGYPKSKELLMAWIDDVLLQCLFDRFGSVFPQCGLMVFPGVVIVSR